MDNSLAQTLSDTFCQVMEQQTFMSPEPIAAGSAEWRDEDFLCATLGFSGQAQGRVWIAAPLGLTHEIAANFLGLDTEDLFVQENAEDALKEVLNITAGNLLTSLYGDRSQFDLSVPDSHPLPQTALEELAAVSESQAFLVEGFPVFVCVVFTAWEPAGKVPC